MYRYQRANFIVEKAGLYEKAVNGREQILVGASVSCCDRVQPRQRPAAATTPGPPSLDGGHRDTAWYIPLIRILVVASEQRFQSLNSIIDYCLIRYFECAYFKTTDSVFKFITLEKIIL